MPLPFVLLAAGAAGVGLLASSRRQLPPDERPFAAFPDGVIAHPLSSEQVTTSSQRHYKVTSFAGADGRVYYVAELRGSLDWMSYLQAPGSSEREFWGGSAATAVDLDAMRRDFDVHVSEVAA